MKTLERKTSKKIQISIGIITVISLIHWLATFFTDKLVFTFPDKLDRAYKFFILDYPVCKAATFVCLFLFYTFIYKVLIDRNKEENEIYKIAKCGLPYLILMVLITAVKIRNGYVTNDEYSILEMALRLEHNTWFTYLTVYFYIISLMLIPFKYSPIFIKVIIEFLVVGCFVYRFKDYFEKKRNNNITGDVLISWEKESFIDRHHLREKILRGSRLRIKRDPKRHEIKYYVLAYLPFLLYPILAYTTSAHRLPVYFLLYLLMVATLIFDKLEEKKLTIKKCFGLLALGALLTHWRTEGIYLFVFLPLLMFLVYSNIRNIQAGIFVIVVSFVLQALVYIPQNVYGVEDLSASATDRMKPFYAYTIVNMMRNGLDREKNAEDLAVVDKYIAIEKIDAVNEHYVDINYEDTFILFDEFNGVRPEASITEYFEFVSAMQNIFKNNPGVFIKTRIGAFVYAAMPYHVSFESGIKGIIKGLFSVFKSLSYNIFIPFITIILILLYALIKKRWFTFFMCGAIMAHWFIVFILAPASYFKYYFPIYMSGYMYITMLIIQTIYNRKALKKITFLG